MAADLEKGSVSANGAGAIEQSTSQISTPPNEKETASVDMKKTGAAGLRSYLNAEVSTSHADILMIACCLCSGFTDSTMFNAYGTFVSMQTGNTIFVGLGASHQDGKPYAWAESLLSIVFYAIGCYVFAAVCRQLGTKKRGTLVGSFFLQSAMIFISAALCQAGVIDGRVPSAREETQWDQIVPIILLSFQAAGQICAGRNLGLNEIPSIVVTSLLYDLFSDPNLADGISKNAKRNRRVFAFAMEMVGAIAGGWVSKATGGVQAALFIVGGIKALITIAWMIWSVKRS